MKRILILPGRFGELEMPDTPELRKEWNVDHIWIKGTADMRDDLETLPFQESEITFFIPVISSLNTLNYDGATLALRIIFKYIQKRDRGINIVLLGSESKASFLQHYSYPNILKIPNVAYCTFNSNIVASYDAPSIKLTERQQFAPYLIQLGLRLPSSFKSTHSLTNEWCIYRWSQFMGYTDPNDGLEGLLYFDYLKAMTAINIAKEKPSSDDLRNRISNLPKARILLVDDNAKWHAFFQEFFASSEIVFDSIGIDFVKKDLNTVKEEVLAKVRDFNPDVILLDFRLIENHDAEVENPEKISGNQVLKALKGDFINPGEAYGRQILIFTATSRIENAMMLRKNNADGFILKEKPEFYLGKVKTKQLIGSMVKQINEHIERADFLIPLNEKLDELDELNVSPISGLKETIKTVLESVRLITQTNSLNEGVLKLTYLNLFSILESIKPSHYKYIDSYIQECAPNKICKHWNNIDEIRNTLAHGDKFVKINDRKKPISIELIREWQIILCGFIKDFIIHQISKDRE